MQQVELISLPPTPYLEAWELQRRRARLCRSGGPGAVIFVEHLPVITLGRAGRRSALLDDPEELRAQGIELVHSDRGGDATFHGPGQLLVYPILNLAHWKKSVHLYLRGLEETVISTLRDFGITGVRSGRGTGVWLTDAGQPDRAAGRKIASIGVHLARWITTHGVSLNVREALEPFRHVRPCGLEGVRMVSMEGVAGRPVARPEVEAAVWKHLSRQFLLAAAADAAGAARGGQERDRRQGAGWAPL